MKFFYWFLILFFIFLCAIGFYFYEKKPRLKDVGLLTDDYGIVTKEDLDRNKRIAFPESFSPEGMNSFSYWQCLKPKKHYLSCQAHYVEPEGMLGEMTFWILANGKKYIFDTPRDYEIEACQANIKEIQAVMLNEKIVCVSGQYVYEKENNSYWMIQYVKSKKGMWSLFVIDP